MQNNDGGGSAAGMIGFRGIEQDYGELVTAVLQQFAAADFEGGWSGIGEKFLDGIGGSRLLDAAGEQRDAILGVGGLPGLQEMVGGGQGGGIVSGEVGCLLRCEPGCGERV